LYFCDKYRIVEKKAIASDIYSYIIKCPEVAGIVQSGQFVNISASGHTLRRPISVCDFDRENGLIRIVFEIRGEGTREISRLREGDYIDMIAPLGRGFSFLDDAKHVALIGGGIGVPPLLSIAKHYGEKAQAVLGFKSFDKVILANDFAEYGADVTICTDDGSSGFKGNVLPCFENVLNNEKLDIIYVCGPLPMIRAISEIAEQKEIPCQVSLEERMGCGVGACIACVCKVKRRDKEMFVRVCKDGPVFNSKEVIF